MKYVLVLLFLSGCGYSSINNEITGQVKKVYNVTPIFCPPRIDVDVSLGVMRNGIGSMSTQDLISTVVDSKAADVLKQAAESGALVKVTHREARFNLCNNLDEITSAEILK